MARWSDIPVPAEQRDWIARHVRKELALMRRVLAGLERMGFDCGHPTTRRVYSVVRTLAMLGRDGDGGVGGVGGGGLWPVRPAPGAPLTDAQRRFLSYLASDAYAELSVVCDHFDRAGCPCKAMAHAARHAHAALGGIRSALHEISREDGRGQVFPSRALDPGLSAPRTLDVQLDHAEHGGIGLLTELLTLTKVNWNSTELINLEPIPLSAARSVGGILRHIPHHRSTQSRFSFFM